MVKMEGIDAEAYEYGAKLLGHIIPVELFNEIVALRRKLHETPELAFEERSTAKGPYLHDVRTIFGHLDP